MSLSDWHHQVSQRYADLHHGKVAEMRKNKATISTPFDSQPLRRYYWEMEQWLIEHGESVQVERKKPKPFKASITERHSILCMKAKQAANGML